MSRHQSAFAIVQHPNLVLHELRWLAGAPPIYAYRLTESGKVLPSFDYFQDFWQALPRELIDPGISGSFVHERGWANKLAKAAERTRTFRRLGFLFEDRLHTLLSVHPRVQNLRAGLKVHKGGRTLGEFDFLFYDNSLERTVHWETAVKFYLASEPSLRWDRFVGPNGLDTLHLKNAKAVRKQLPLSRTAEGKEVIGNTTGPVPVTASFFLMMGWLFYRHRPDRPSPRATPLGVNPNHRRGLWMRFGEELPAGDNWRVLQRTEWLGDFTPLREGPFLNRKEAEEFLTGHFASSRRSVLMANLDDERRERGRVFVVDKAWPEIQ